MRLAEVLGVMGMCWTPDAKWLVFGEADAEGRYSLSALQVQTGERRPADKLSRGR